MANDPIRRPRLAAISQGSLIAEFDGLESSEHPSAIYFVNLNPVQGREQAEQTPVFGALYQRHQSIAFEVLVVVVEDQRINIPRDYPTNVRCLDCYGLLQNGVVFLCFKSVFRSGRFPAEPAGQLSEEKMLQVEATVRYCLGL